MVKVFGFLISPTVNLIKFLTDLAAKIGSWLGQKWVEATGTEAQREVDAKLKALGQSFPEINVSAALVETEKPKLETGAKAETEAGAGAGAGTTGKTPEQIAAEAEADTQRKLTIKEEERVAEFRKKTEQEINKMSIQSDAAHAETMRRIAFENAQAAFEVQTKIAARQAADAIPRGITEASEKAAEVDRAAAEKIVNIKAAAAAKERAEEEATNEKIAKIREEQAIRQSERQAEDQAKHDSGQQESFTEMDARLALRNAQDQQSAQSITDLLEESAAKINDANLEAAERVIDEQEAAANKRADIEYEAAVKAADVKYQAELKRIDKEQAPEMEEAPHRETHTRIGRGGEIIEGSIERKEREARNKARMDEFHAQQDREREEAARRKAAEEKAAADKDRREKEAARATAEMQAKAAADEVARKAYLQTPEGKVEAYKAMYGEKPVVAVDEQGRPLPAEQQPYIPERDVNYWRAHPELSPIPNEKLPPGGEISPKATAEQHLATMSDAVKEIQTTNSLLKDIEKELADAMNVG